MANQIISQLCHYESAINESNQWQLGLLVGTSKSALIRKDETIPTPTDDYPWPSRDVGMLRGREGYAVDGQNSDAWTVNWLGVSNMFYFP